jgi:hypothetical protein
MQELRERGAMSEIQRYDPCTFMPDDNGEIVFWDKVKDRLVPDEWPGVYPRHSGWWQFKLESGRVICIQVETRLEEGLGFRTPGGRWFRMSETKSDQWGPEIKMVKP